MRLHCDDANEDEVQDLSEYARPPMIVSRDQSPSPFDLVCTLTVTPKKPLTTPLALAWSIGGSISWGHKDRDAGVDVEIEFTRR